MAVTERLRQLRLLALQFGELCLQLLDESIRQDGWKRIERGVIILDRAQLIVEGFFFDAGRPSLRYGSIEVRESLHDDILTLLQRDGVVLFPIPLQRDLTLLDLFSLLGELTLQPFGCVPRGGVLKL